MSPELLWISPPETTPSGPRLTPLVELREMEKYMEQQLRQVMLSHKALTDPQCLGVLKKCFFCTGTGTPPVVEVNTVKARYVFFMLCQKREGKDILVVNGIVRKWYTKMSCTGLIGWFDDAIWWDRRELVGKAHRGNTWPTCKGLLHSAEVGEAQHGKSWTITITKKNQGKQHEPFKPQNTQTTTGGGFSNTLPHCFQFSSSKIREIFQRIVGWPYLNLLNWMLPGGVSTICLRQKDQLRIFSSFTARLRSLGRGGGRWQWRVFGWFFDLSCGSLNMENPRNTVKFVWNWEKHQKEHHVFFTVALLDTFGLDEVCGQLEMIEKKERR